MNQRTRIAVAMALLAVAAAAVAVEYWPRQHENVPESGFSLRGKFIGSAAAADAAAFAGVVGAVADALEQDGKSRAPRVTTGVQMEDLRIAISEMRFAPQTFRERQPHARNAVGKYLDEVGGTSGGPLDAATRERWVKAFREVQKASEEAVK